MFAACAANFATLVRLHAVVCYRVDRFWVHSGTPDGTETPLVSNRAIADPARLAGPANEDHEPAVGVAPESSPALGTQTCSGSQNRFERRQNEHGAAERLPGAHQKGAVDGGQHARGPCKHG